MGPDQEQRWIKETSLGPARHRETRWHPDHLLLGYWAVSRDQILMVFAYPKNELEGLSDRQLAELAKVAKKEFGNG